MASKWCSCAVLVIAMLAAASLQAQILGTLYNFNGAPMELSPSADWFGSMVGSMALRSTAAPIRLQGLCRS